MIIMFILNVIVIALGGIFTWLPEVSILPTIAGYDIDAGLVLGMGYTNRMLEALWPLAIMFQGFLFIVGYYMIKTGLRFLLGTRAP
jgi:hypothetical protein